MEAEWGREGGGSADFENTSKIGGKGNSGFVEIVYKNCPIVLVYLAILSVRKLQGISGRVYRDRTLPFNIKRKWLVFKELLLLFTLIMRDLEENYKNYFSSANFVRFVCVFPSYHKTFNYIRKQVIKDSLFFQ
jgi:hypothetical protein